MNKEDAITLMPWVGVLERKEGKPIRLSVPAKSEIVDGRHTGPRQAIVALERNGTALTAVCNVMGMGDSAEPSPCPGCRRGPCYHILAALYLCAEETGGVLDVGAGPLTIHVGTSKTPAQYIPTKVRHAPNRARIAQDATSKGK